MLSLIDAAIHRYGPWRCQPFVAMLVCGHVEFPFDRLLFLEDLLQISYYEKTNQ